MICAQPPRSEVPAASRTESAIRNSAGQRSDHAERLRLVHGQCASIDRRIVQVMDRVKIRGGRKCVVLYAWEVPDRLDEEYIAHPVFLFEDGDRIEPHEYQLSFRPFTLRRDRGGDLTGSQS